LIFLEGTPFHTFIIEFARPSDWGEEIFGRRWKYFKLNDFQSKGKLKIFSHLSYVK
jgi:hypothetical protein